jgi:hypothetical protein
MLDAVLEAARLPALWSFKSDAHCSALGTVDEIAALPRFSASWMAGLPAYEQQCADHANTSDCLSQRANCTSHVCCAHYGFLNVIAIMNGSFPYFAQNAISFMVCCSR